MKDYRWYDIVRGDDPLEQGDFIDSCPIVIPPQAIEVGQTPKIDVHEYNIVILSQSCDLENRKIDIVLVCPVWPLAKMEEADNFFRSRNGKNILRDGGLPGYHLLNKCDIQGFEKDFHVVDFRNVYGTHFNFLENIARQRDPRLRLLSPYKEHLSQAFARFFMRVGLPVNIPKF